MAYVTWEVDYRYLEQGKQHRICYSKSQVFIDFLGIGQVMVKNGYPTWIELKLITHFPNFEDVITEKILPLCIKCSNLLHPSVQEKGKRVLFSLRG